VADLHPVTSVTASPAAQNMVRLDIGVDDALRDAFNAPGQYVMASFFDGKPKPLALACAPGSTSFVFLVKEEDDAQRDKLLAMTAADLQMSAPEGPGFPLDKADGTPLWLVGVGSGIAPLLSVAEHLKADLRDRDVTLLYGVRSAAHLAVDEELQALAKAGLAVHMVYSRDDVDGARKGYVQDHVAALAPAADTVTFMCGLRPMEDALQEALTTAGASADNAFRNYGW